ncbi:hypothetical protein SK128_014586, partial [Halocaridina rubra]
ESPGMPNGSALPAFSSMNSLEVSGPILPSSPALNSSIKNSISVPGTPLSTHSQLSMKPSNSFTNLQEYPSTTIALTPHGDNPKTSVNYPLTNNLSENSIEDNGEARVLGNPNVIPNMGRHMSLDYKENNLDNEGAWTHRRESSFS